MINIIGVIALVMMINIISNLLTEPIKTHLGSIGQFLTGRWGDTFFFGVIALLALLGPGIYRRIRGLK